MNIRELFRGKSDNIKDTFAGCFEKAELDKREDPPALISSRDLGEYFDAQPEARRTVDRTGRENWGASVCSSWNLSAHYDPRGGGRYHR